jgi:RNA polymerase sigma-70 factor (ECF subfamily)
MDAETEVLIDQCKLGDSEALHKLLARYQGKILRIVRLRLDNKTRNVLKMQSMDVLQEVFITAFRNIQDFKSMTKGSFCHWLSKIVENRIKDLLDHALAQKRTAPGGEQSLDEIHEMGSDDGLRLVDIIRATNTSPTQYLHRRNIASAIDGIMLKLEDQEREIIILYKYEELTFREIAEMLQKKEDAVRKQFKRAFTKLLALAEMDSTLQELRQ